MRAIYFDNLVDCKNNHLVITGDSLHHLLNVIRLKIGEDILFLDGQGTSAKGSVVKISKREILCNLEELEFHTREKSIDVIIGRTKRDYFEQIIRTCVEVGVGKVYVFQSDFSQSIELRQDRMTKLLISSLEQSNSYFLPNVQEIETLNQLNDTCSLYTNVFWFNSKSEHFLSKPPVIKNSAKLAVLVGPEGGFSSSEIQFFRQNSVCNEVHLPVPIMKAVTAVPVALGYVHGIMDKSY